MSRYILGIDEGLHGGDLTCYTMIDVMTGKIVWRWTGIGEPKKFPWWLRLRMFFRMVTVCRESNSPSPEFVYRLQQMQMRR